MAGKSSACIASNSNCATVFKADPGIGDKNILDVRALSNFSIKMELLSRLTGRKVLDQEKSGEQLLSVKMENQSKTRRKLSQLINLFSPSVSTPYNRVTLLTDKLGRLSSVRHVQKTKKQHMIPDVYVTPPDSFESILVFTACKSLDTKLNALNKC